jgi:hypothetical protein
MKRLYVVEGILVLVIAFLFCISLFSVYDFQQTKMNNMEKDVSEIKTQVYNLRMDLLTVKEQLLKNE